MNCILHRVPKHASFCAIASPMMCHSDQFLIVMDAIGGCNHVESCGWLCGLPVNHVRVRGRSPCATTEGTHTILELQPRQITPDINASSLSEIGSSFTRVQWVWSVLR